MVCACICHLAVIDSRHADHWLLFRSLSTRFWMCQLQTKNPTEIANSIWNYVGFFAPKNPRFWDEISTYMKKISIFQYTGKVNWWNLNFQTFIFLCNKNIMVGSQETPPGQLFNEWEYQDPGQKIYLLVTPVSALKNSWRKWGRDLSELRQGGNCLFTQIFSCLSW